MEKYNTESPHVLMFQLTRLMHGIRMIAESQPLGEVDVQNTALICENEEQYKELGKSGYQLIYFQDLYGFPIGYAKNRSIIISNGAMRKLCNELYELIGDGPRCAKNVLGFYEEAAESHAVLDDVKENLEDTLEFKETLKALTEDISIDDTIDDVANLRNVIRKAIEDALQGSDILQLDVIENLDSFINRMSSNLTREANKIHELNSRLSKW